MRKMTSDKTCGEHALGTALGITLLTLVLLAGSAGAVPVVEWNKTFGGKHMVEAYSVQQTQDGGYILAGDTDSYGAGGAWLIKTDAKGNEQWNKTFGKAYLDDASSVNQTLDGGYILAGSTSSQGSGNRDAWLIKTDAQGNKQWDKTFGGLKNDNAYSGQQTPDGGYILAGETSLYGAGDSFAWLIKTDATGNEQWNRTFGGTWRDIAYSVQLTIDGGYILAGTTLSNISSDSTAWLLKTDAKGNEQWNKRFKGIGYRASSAQQTIDGGYILAGSAFNRLSDALLIKTDANGNEQWNKTFGGVDDAALLDDESMSVQQTTDAGFIMTGYTVDERQVRVDAWLIKTDANGNKRWNKTFGKNYERAYSVQQTKDGGYILAGTNNLPHAWLIKVSKEQEEAIAGTTEKVAGFYVVLAIAAFSVVCILVRGIKNSTAS
ncbi:MAG: hypothetical protein ABOK23_00340 [Candidatus Methanoperedens sp.]|nr:hypothetical protein [Candidatus Methanoperedens sp.]MCZ7395781.1 hypothetical protein [Candidatus Methanoperedens sp.]